MHKVVLGGGLASGKSTVAAMMERMGAHVSNLDAIAKDVRNLPEVARMLAGRFGDDILDSQGHPIPSLLAERAFADEESLTALNSITHPMIAKMARRFLLECQPGEVRVLEVPLLKEAQDLREMADEVVVVIAGQDTRAKRAVSRGMGEDDAKRRISAQISDYELVALADTVIMNDSTVEALRQKVADWWVKADKIAMAGVEPAEGENL